MFIKRLLLLITGLAIINHLAAQLCQGSLGDAAVNITFGSGPNPGAQLSSGITNYFYISDVCPNDGFYTIANSTNNCFNNTWLTLNEDHTPGDNSGYMMLVNASFSPKVFFVQPVGGLCGGTTYEFAAWLINVIRPTACNGLSNKPNITFNIETTSGQLLQTYNTGDIDATDAPVWKQYGLFFTTPSNTSSVVIKITNNAMGGCGNDLALDDITFRPCGPKVSLSINGVAGNKNICISDTARLNLNSNLVGGYSNTFYQWQKSADSLTWNDIPGANAASYLLPPMTTAGKYFFRLQVADGSNIVLPSCRIASEVAVVLVNPLPVTTASNNGAVCEGKALTLMATGGNEYAWAGPANFTNSAQSPVVTNVSLSNSGLYRVKVTSAAGCINYDSTIVVVNNKPVADAGDDVTICEGVTTVLQGSGTNANSYVWSPASGLSNPLSLSPLATPAQSTLYILTVSDGKCDDSAAVLVSVVGKPAANAGPDKALVGSQGVDLNGQVTGSNVFYFWTPDIFISSDTILNPHVSPPFDTAYVLHAISNDGCGEASDTVLVRYFKEIYIPNAFTPNNDGLNDRWNIPPLTAFPLAEVRVYNRFGELIFFNRGNTLQWEGTYKGILQLPGLYIYTIDLKNGYKKLRGVITLLR